MKNPRILTLFATSFSLTLVGLAFAQTAHAASDLTELLCEAGDIVVIAAGVLIALSILVFIWGLVKFIARADSEDGRREGKQVMLWGIVAIFVLSSLGGIVIFMQESLFGVEVGGIEVADTCP